MKPVPENVYTENFGAIHDWFHDHIHAAPEYHDYSTVNLPKTSLKLIELIENGKVMFRVLLKATFDNVKQAGLLEKNVWDLSYLTTAKSLNVPSSGMAYQICYVQLDGKNVPIDGTLYTYALDELHKII